MRRRAIWIVAAGGLVWITFTWPSGLMYCAPSRWIEGYLLRQTPLGSDERAVRNWLAFNGALDENGLPKVGPPLSRVGVLNDEMLDPNFVRRWDEAIARFRFPRSFEVRATYTFDNRGHLKDVQVRKTKRDQGT